jgi:hypothetical protein
MSVCPTDAENAAMLACFNAQLNDFLGDVLRALELAAGHGSGGVFMLDMRGNGGGNVVLAALTMAMVDQRLRDMPQALFPAVDMVHSPLVSSLLQFSAQPGKPAVLDDRGGVLADSGEPITQGDASWYSDGPNRIRSGVEAQYSSKFRLFEASVLDIVNWDAVPVLPMPKANRMVVTNGGCGSACALSVAALQMADSMMVFNVGGIPGVQSDGGSFPGGFIWNDGYTSLAEAYAYAVSEGYEAPAGVVAAEYLPTSASFHMLEAEAYWGDLDVPLQYTFRRTDGRLDVWPTAFDAGLYALVLDAAAAEPGACTVSGSAAVRTTGAMAFSWAFTLVLLVWQRM